MTINQGDIEARREALMGKGRRLIVLVTKPGITNETLPLYLVKDPDAGTGVGAKPPQSGATAESFANDGWKVYSFNDVGTAYNL